ncbi:MAG: 50S ribosomal protein L22 [Thermodesulfobacteriota bacterium]
METRAVAKYIGVSPQKTRLVIDLIRGRGVEDALFKLSVCSKAVAETVAKVLRSAIANAENTGAVDVDNLYVKKVFVDQGPSMKRMRPRAMGRANMIKKRTSHITVVVDER